MEQEALSKEVAFMLKPKGVGKKITMIKVSRGRALHGQRP